MNAVKGSGIPIKVWDNLGKKQTINETLNLGDH